MDKENEKVVVEEGARCFSRRKNPKAQLNSQMLKFTWCKAENWKEGQEKEKTKEENLFPPWQDGQGSSKEGTYVYQPRFWRR